MDIVAAALAKARRRLLPFLFLLYVVSYLDRINVGFAALQMNAALGFSSVTYSLGAGIFFLSYTLLEIPSNVILARVGARLWIARIMITWGIVSAGMMFVRSATAFYVLRFALGAAEAGFFPGIIYCLTRWFPRRERARAIAGFMTAVVAAGIIGGPISGALLSLDGAGGLAGWQWLFVVEGLPAVVLGLVVLRALPEQPSDARWLTPAEQQALTARLAEEATAASTVHSIRGALTSGRVWLLAAVYFTIPVALYAMGFWMPQIVRSASGRQRLQYGTAQRDSICCCGRRHGRHRPQLRPHGRAALAHRALGHRRRRGVRAHGIRARHRAVDRAAVAGDARPRVDARPVLGVRDVVSRRHRRGRRHRARQLGREHRRLRRPEHHRLRAADDERVHRRARGHRRHSLPPEAPRLLSVHWACVRNPCCDEGASDPRRAH